MNGRCLRASINQTEVGTLQEVAGLWSFQYTEAWLSNPLGFALSPHLPLTADAFGLLAWYGAESAGSVTLLPPDAALQVAEPLRPLPDNALETRIRQLPRAPLTHAAIKRMSLAGAQHKLAVVLQEDALFEPAGATPSTHILKPDHPDEDYPHP